MKKAFVVMIFALFLFSSMAFAIAQNNSNNENNNSQNNNVCATDVKQCEDGTYVSRNPDNECKFMKCFDEDDDSEDESNYQCDSFDQTECERNIRCSWNGKIDECERKMNQIMRKIELHVRNRLRAGIEGACPDECTCAGSTIKCDFNGSRQMTVITGNSGNVIVQMKNANMSTKVELYKQNGTLWGIFRGNETGEIVMPDQIKERVRERLRQRDCDCENITLDEDGYYQVRAQKKARLFYIFPVREKTQLQLDAENGEIIRVRNPWWGFLAKDDVEVE